MSSYWDLLPIVKRTPLYIHNDNIAIETFERVNPEYMRFYLFQPHTTVHVLSLIKFNEK